jgi:hypothetical protein
LCRIVPYVMAKKFNLKNPLRAHTTRDSAIRF